jgi:TolB-like protein/DNA-binding winged helix-turn-helix (wHTH) protein
MPPESFSVGPFTFDPDQACLWRGSERVPLGHKAAALLSALAHARGTAVTKADLMEAVWPGLAVEEGNLTVQIAGLRKALGPGPQGQDWIVTVPRVGYRLVLPQPIRPEVPEPLKLALAVLPFANLGGDAEQDYFADGVVEDIITALSRFKSCAVIARNSSFTYKGKAVDVRQVGQDLGVRYVLEGSIRRAGDRLRIAAQLVECENGKHIWAEHFDGKIDEVFDFQDRITESVASVVESHIQKAEIERSRRQRPGSVAAYDLYLRALPKLSMESAEDNQEAFALLTGALELEPDNPIFLALATAALGDRGMLGYPPIGPDDTQKCAALARRGLERAAGDATVIAHCSMALLHNSKDYDWAMAAIVSAVEANPNDLLVVSRAGIAHLHCGNIADALAYFHRAIRLSPRDPNAHTSLTGIAHCQMVLGDYAEALVWATRSLTLKPKSHFAYWMVIAANAQLGRMDEARKSLAEFRKLAPWVTIASIWAGQPQRDPSRCATILDGLRLAGLAEA